VSTAWQLARKVILEGETAEKILMDDGKGRCFNKA
jgi:hypothetical protein